MMKDRTIGVVGLGLLGRGIAACLLGHGFRVVGFAPTELEIADARQYIGEAIDALIDRASFDPALSSEWSKRFTSSTEYGQLADCQFIVESVVEDLTTKDSVFDRIEAVVGAQVPIASNTSALPISTLQRKRKHPQRLLGMHWAEPAHATRFMELVRGEQTGDAAFAAAHDLALDLNKNPSLVQKDVRGFIVNRLGYAMYREALHLLESGVADAATIDRSFSNACGLWAAVCGPLRWIDLTGGPAAYAAAMRGVLPTLSNTADLPPTLARLASEGALGIVNGRGFYRYGPDEARYWKDLYEENVWRVRDIHEPMRREPTSAALGATHA